MNVLRKACIIIGTFFSSLSPNWAFAYTDPLLAVRQVAEDFVSGVVEKPALGKLRIEAGYIDPRLRLTICPTQLNATIPGKQKLNSTVTVQVTCPDHNWQVYVPVAIKLFTPVVVAKRPLDRGMILLADDLSIQLVESRLQRGQSFDDISDISGARTKRSIGMGQPISGFDICVVCRNDEVIINASGDGLNIITKGTALSDGGIGEQIKVRNNRSRRIVDAIVTGIGEVSVNF
ncbi:flagellar basal body P-ring formation chaperone FlgA [Parasalinivibrio latis]|uniref:flagellar basal body P-ring formation chaperone FlgA n=1 Tax=Parasalinivibrio latis TaxID=2952610 RepID=UPI0030E34FC4